MNTGYFEALAEATGRSLSIKARDGSGFPGSRAWPANYFLSPRGCTFNIEKMRKPDTMSPMKNPKRPFYDFKMKIMMYLDYSF